MREDLQLTIAPSDYSLLTDLYQLTMGACYAGEGLETAPASFELFARRLPAGFGYLIAMGLAQAVDYLEKWQFSSTQLDALRSTGIFEGAPASFWSMLADGQFSGDVWAVPEGTAVFPHEPVLRVEAPLWQAQHPFLGGPTSCDRSDQYPPVTRFGAWDPSLTQGEEQA